VRHKECSHDEEYARGELDGLEVTDVEEAANDESWQKYKGVL
jgi:hypothetical protein